MNLLDWAQTEWTVELKYASLPLLASLVSQWRDKVSLSKNVRWVRECQEPVAGDNKGQCGDEGKGKVFGDKQ